MYKGIKDYASEWYELYHEHRELKKSIQKVLDQSYSYETGDSEKLSGDPNDHWVVDKERLEEILNEY